jgi:hypothetical protein
MKRQAEIGILVALFLVLGGVLYRSFRPTSDAAFDGPGEVIVQPLKVPNPALHLGQLASIRQMVYSGSRRNIFTATPPPPPAPPKSAVKDAQPPVPAGSPMPPPLEIPLKFYGMAIDPKTGNKLAFFTNGDNVYLASPGETLLGHFRLLSIGNDTVRIEDTTTSQAGTVVMTPLSNP